MAIDNIQGGLFQNAQGTALNAGSITFQLSQPAQTISDGQVVENPVISVTLNSSGSVPNGTPLYGNDQLTPLGTYYIVNIYNAQGGRVRGPENWSIVGASPIDLGTIVAASPSISYSGVVLLDPIGNQTIENGSLTVNSSIISQLGSFILEQDDAYIELADGGQQYFIQAGPRAEQFTITATSITSNVLAVTGSGATFSSGNQIYLEGTQEAFLNNQIVTVLASPAPTSTSFSANFTNANYTNNSDNGFAVNGFLQAQSVAILPDLAGGSNVNNAGFILGTTGTTAATAENHILMYDVGGLMIDTDIVANAGKITGYNGVNTAGGGIPSIVAQNLSPNLNANFNAGASTSLYQTVATGPYRFTGGLTVINTPSSGSSPNLVLQWTDIGGVPRSTSLWSVVGSISSNATTQSNVFSMYCANNSNINVVVGGYAPGGTPNLRYSLAMTVEAL